MRWAKVFRGLAFAVLVTAAVLGVSATAAQAQATGVTVNTTGTFQARTGVATISGTYACGDTSGFAFVEVVLSQPVGRVSTVSGSAFAEIPECTPGASGTWTATVSPSNGKFRGGSAQASARLVVNGVGEAETAQTVRLHG